MKSTVTISGTLTNPADNQAREMRVSTKSGQTVAVLCVAQPGESVPFSGSYTEDQVLENRPESH